MTMRFDSLAAFRRSGAPAVGPGPTALVVVEDAIELASTFDHLAARGVRAIVACAPPGLALPERHLTAVIECETRGAEALSRVVNTVIDVADPGTWLHPCYNAEYVHYPFCESRSVGEMLRFHAEERRDAMLGYTVDLYARDLARHSSGVDRTTAQFDRIGYYALARTDPDYPEQPRARQLDIFGGLRWRFEEHTEPTRRRIDRIAFLRTLPGLRMQPDGTLSTAELNTYACPWHNNLTAAICSFRAAKALRSNPLSRDAIGSFLWQGSTPFEWSSGQLMAHGLMEPGQWL